LKNFEFIYISHQLPQEEKDIFHKALFILFCKRVNISQDHFKRLRDALRFIWDW